MIVRFKLKDLLFWTIHGIVASTPSFIIALTAGFNSVLSILGMITGVTFLIFIYSLLTSTHFFSISRDANFSRSLRLAAHLRALFAALSIIAAISLYVFHSANPVFNAVIFLDLWTGFFGISAANYVMRGSNAALYSFQKGFFSAFTSTLTTGMIFSLEFFALSIAVTALRRFVLYIMSRIKAPN